MQNKITIDLKNSTMPVNIQLIEQGPAGKEFYAYVIVTFFAGSFLYNSLCTASDWVSNTRLHEHIIDSFENDFGFDDQRFQVFMLESFDSPVVNLIE